MIDSRSESFQKIRPSINLSDSSQQSLAEESFQNSTLRPVLKLQNELFILVLRNYFKKHKNSFYSLSLEKRHSYIEQAVQKDIKFRNSLKGMIVACFTSEEYERYTANSSALNKRMMQMLVQRYHSQIQLFDSPNQ